MPHVEAQNPHKFNFTIFKKVSKYFFIFNN